VQKNLEPEESDNIDIHEWQNKVARYVAYSIDGGLLQSKFTLTKMIKMMEHVTSESSSNNQKILQDEIQYMLNI
jgi:hypothetical protein